MLFHMFLIKIVMLIEFVAFIKGTNELAETSLSRKKRYLLFPDGTNVIQMIIGIGVPVEVKPESIIFGWAFRAFYTMPSNLSELMEMDYGSRRTRSVSRWDIYQVLEQESDYRGLGGRPCILRSICEVADIPFNRDHGLFEELFHSIFTPTSTNEVINHHTDNEYYAAQLLGKKHKGKCKYFYPDCKISLMEMFTHSPDEGPVFPFL